MSYQTNDHICHDKYRNNVMSNQMEVSVFIENIQKAFGEKVQLHFAFWYSDKQINDDLKKINCCFFKEFEKLIGG